MKKQTLVVIVTVAILLLLLSAGNGNLLAGPPTPEKMIITGNARNAFTYQGRLTDTSGKPLNGQYNMNFQLWDALTAGNQVGSDISAGNVTVENGVFNAVIPVPESTFTGRALWLRIQVGSEWLSPRQEILPVPYAMSLTPGAVISGTANSYLITALNNSTSGFGGGLRGAVQSSATNSVGVWGFSHASTGWSNGVAGGTRSSEGVGVIGYNEAITGGWGVWAEAQGTSGWAVGVEGGTKSPEGVGVNGVNYATTGWARGVNGESYSPDGIGVAGLHNNGGIGVYASSITGTALYAKSDSGWLIQAVSANDSDTEFYVSNDGNVYADGTYRSPAADFAEMFPAQSGLEPGDVLIIGLDGKLARSTEPYQMAVVGIYSTQPGFLGGASEDVSMDDRIPLAIVGIVPVKVSAENGPIHPGDLLTPSATPGYAMVCQNRLDCVGAIIGKALEQLEEGTGMITVLITLQ